MRILVVDDDQYILDLLTYLFTREGHSVVTALDGQQALAYFRVEKPDLVISEVDLPKLGGYELCEMVKESGPALFIFLSERGSEKDILKGFAAGADDYIAKPFSPRILMARVGAVARKIAAPVEGVSREKLQMGELTLDASRLEVTGPRGTVRLSPTEFEILHTLASNKGVVVAEERLGELVWGSEGRGKAGLVKSRIHQIRQRIEPDPNSPRYLLTVPGVGYTMTPLRPISSVRHPEHALLWDWEAPQDQTAASEAREPSDHEVRRGISILRPLETIEGIGGVYAAKLLAAGMRSVEALLEKGCTPKGRKEIEEATGIGRALILEWVNLADLMRIKGIGEEYADLLEEAGVDTIKELRKRVPANLYQNMLEVNEAKRLVRRPPALSQVESWVEQAKSLPPKVTY